MWRIAGLILLFALGGPAHAAPFVGAWETCRGALTPAGRPLLSDCRPLRGLIDPQGRELWLRAPVRPKTAAEARPSALYIFGAASSQAWFNGSPLGSNGLPGPTAETERPGRYQAVFPIPEGLWRSDHQEVIVRLSAFHVGMRFDRPVGDVAIGRYPQPSLLPQLAVTFVAAGALLAAFVGFAAVHAMRRTGSSLTLAAMAGVAAVQAFVENYRSLVNYPYPLHVWRVNAIWGLSGAYALLLAAFAASRFLPGRRRPFVIGAGLVIAATYLLRGFDVKSFFALIAGVGFATVAAAIGVLRQQPGARAAVAYLVAFLIVAFVSPFGLLDVSYFLLAASLTLPLMVIEVVRLGREDRDREAALTRAASRPDRLTVATSRGVQLVPLADILAVLGADDYVELRLTGGRGVLHAARLDQLEAQLPPSFLRVHRSAIANLAHVDGLERDGSRWRLCLGEGPPLPVSRARLAAVREALEAPPVALRATA